MAHSHLNSNDFLTRSLRDAVKEALLNMAEAEITLRLKRYNSREENEALIAAQTAYSRAIQELVEDREIPF